MHAFNLAILLHNMYGSIFSGSQFTYTGHQQSEI